MTYLLVNKSLGLSLIEAELWITTTPLHTAWETSMVQLENYDLTAIMETWWDESHKWNTGIKVYKLFRRDTQGRRGRGVALYVREETD